MTSNQNKEEAAPQAAKRGLARLRGRWSRRILWGLSIFGIYLGMQSFHGRDAAEGRPPVAAMTLIDGTEIDLGNMDGPAIVHFWATWCGTCKAMDGAVESMAADHRVVTIASQSGNPGQVRAFLEHEALSFPTVADPNGALARAFGVAAFPTTFYLNDAGDIERSNVGFSTSWGMRARLFWTGL